MADYDFLKEEIGYRHVLISPPIISDLIDRFQVTSNAMRQGSHLDLISTILITTLVGYLITICLSETCNNVNFVIFSSGAANFKKCVNFRIFL